MRGCDLKRCKRAEDNTTLLRKAKTNIMYRKIMKSAHIAQSLSLSEEQLLLSILSVVNHCVLQRILVTFNCCKLQIANDMNMSL